MSSRVSPACNEIGQSINASARGKRLIAGWGANHVLRLIPTWSKQAIVLRCAVKTSANF